MSVLKRVIPCLDVGQGPRREGHQLRRLRDAGDPVELAERYDAEGADELVFLDITASHEERDTIVRLARRTADNVFIPFTIGGGIRSREDAQAVLDAGADKVSVNSAAVARPELIDELADTFGAQCVVLAIDAKRDGEGGFEVFVNGGRVATGRDAVEWAREGGRARSGGDPAHQHGPRRHQGRLRPRADARGRDAVDIPVIASGGAGSSSTSARRSTRRAPTRCWSRRSSTTGSTGSGRRRSTCTEPESRYACSVAVLLRSSVEARGAWRFTTSQSARRCPCGRPTRRRSRRRR